MIQNITNENFKLFGHIIEHPGKDSGPKDKNLFTIVLREPLGIGWRIAYLVLRDRTIDKLEKHPDSFESFEPVKGRTLLYVATEEKPDEIKCFVLDKPVILNKGVWHGVVTIDEESEIKISENADVECVFLGLDCELTSKGIKKRVSFA